LIIFKKIFCLIFLSAGILRPQTELNFPKFRIYPSSFTQTEPVISINPLDHSILFASAVTLNVGGGFSSEGVYVSTDGGNTWRGTDTCKGSLIYNHGGDPGVVITESGRFIISHIGLIFPGTYTHYSDDLGLNWSIAATVTNHQTGDKGTIALDYSNQSSYKGRVYLAWVDLQTNPSAVFTSYSTDEGVSWSNPQVINPNPPLRCVGGSIATGNNGTVYTCWSGITLVSPFIEDYAGFSVSTNGGASWNYQQNIFDMNGISGTLPTKGNIKVNGLPQVVVDNSGGVRDGWIYIVTTEKNISPAGSDPDIILHRSTNGGVTWSQGIRVNQDPINNGKIQYFPYIEIDNQGGIDILFHDDRNTTSDSTDIFLTRSMDGGNTWKEFSLNNSRFKPKPIIGGASSYQGDHISLLAVDDKLYALWMADYSGIYQVWASIFDLNVLSVDESNYNLATQFHLFQNYPNPFNPSTKIKYSIEKESFVQVKIYDMLGNEITTLVNEEKTAGVYEVDFNKRNIPDGKAGLPSGVYFYRLTADRFSQTMKFVLIK
jgi:hypothetical protein